jgi:hypothetical protein
MDITMKFDLETARAEKFADIMQGKKLYPYECKLKKRNDDEEDVDVRDLISWLEQNTQGRWNMIKDNHEIWGFSFQLKKDAMLWKLRWS